MGFSYFIARRVALQGRKSFSAWIIRIAIAAVALSVAVMIAASALIAGFKKEITNKVFGFWGHIHITAPAIYSSLLDARPISKKQAFYPSLDTVNSVPYFQKRNFLGYSWEETGRTRGGVRHIQTTAIKPGIIKSKNEIEGIILKGVGTDFDWQFFQQYLQDGKALQLQDSTFSSEILISRSTARRLQTHVGDRFEVHFVNNGSQVIRRFTVAGIYKTGLEEYDKLFALVDIRQVQQLLNWEPDQIGSFEVFVDNIDELDAVQEDIYFSKLPQDLYSETIRNKMPEIFQWLELQNINEKVIYLLMILVAVVNMITALLILILERTNMIGTLKALGANNWQIRRIFLLHAGYITALGLLLGNLLGIGFCLAQKYGQFIRLSEENYYLSVAPIEINPITVLILNIGALVIILLCLLLPSLLVTRITPVRAIRFK